MSTTTAPRDLVQPIIVRTDVPRPQIIASAAAMSVTALRAVPSPAWDEWLDGSFTKSVRKAPKPHHVSEWADELGWADDGVAAAGPPALYDDYPSKVRKARVEGWDDQVLRSAWPPRPSARVEIVLNSSLDLTTGKAAAQAAHALMALLIGMDRVNYPITARDLRVSEASETNILSGQSVGLWQSVIRDAGRTEIPAGSLTAVARWI